MRKQLIVGAVAVLMTIAAWAVPALAGKAGIQVSVCDGWGGCAAEYNSWQGVSVSDSDCDGQGVYSNYKRDTGSSQVLSNYSGCGTTEYSGTSSNPVSQFRACTDVPFVPDHCSEYVQR